MPRSSDHPIDRIFLDRQSPRSFTDDEIPEAELLTLLEAARWAPSSSNIQPWRFIWARRGTEQWKQFLPLLLPGNRRWADRAAALVFIVSATERVKSDGTSAPSATHAYDAGITSGFLALQAHMRGWSTHFMAGIDKDGARSALHVPDSFAIHTAVAIGRRGPAEALSEELRAREVPSDRRPLDETAFEGRFPADP
ncbi:Nitroreductase [Palleronia marisminoris]|uniref:5,6-dimethylbenzimidazole synthase n=1 Tax=Palleronia marisminoris TaxID=315423 RepID=A0A1Y5T8H8_9RHOB|nr:nitroreductase family protein [Palleronia marisminoris]SFH22834.1 Nitroreductase [Palleronia marisminoris]SLN58044.1 5,6-dimethylbenzimidazole synthase [Palleronia marisminoris]